MELIQLQQVGFMSRFAVLCRIYTKKVIEKKNAIPSNKKRNLPKDIRDERKVVDKIRNQITYAQRFVNRYEQRQREGEVDPIIVGDENKK